MSRTRTALEESLGRDLSELELAVVMIDGIDLADITHVVALGIATDGTKIPLSPRESSTENATVATALLADLADPGVRLGEQQLFVLDGANFAMLAQVSQESLAAATFGCPSGAPTAPSPH